MSDKMSPTKLDFKSSANLYLGLAAVLVLFLASGLVAYLNTQSLNRNAELIASTHEILLTINDVLSLTKDAETGQRGYVITGDEKYLEPFSAALVRIDSRVEELQKLTRDIPDQRAHIAPLKAALEAKLRELDETIALRRAQGFEATRNLVMTDRGKAAMDAIRSEVNAMQQAERERRMRQLAAMDTAFKTAVASGVLTAVVGIVLSGVVAYLLRRAILDRRWQDWLQAGQIGSSKVMVGDPRLDRLGEKLLRFLAEYLDAQAGAVFTRMNQGNIFHRIASYGVPNQSETPQQFEASDGLLGQAVRDARTFVLNQVPDGYLTIGSGLGHGKPRHLLIVPAMVDDTVIAVIELGFLQPVNESVMELFERIGGSIGAAVRSANDRVHLQSLLEETQRQAEELQSQGEELRVSNEELEEQSRVLKESQSRLELQQTEMEQTNAQLEEQAQLLENQRDEATRSRMKLEQQAREIERASQYKSDFLANMSHELRTPLNSSLILAKLLADNREGNLTAEQIKYAETIGSAGNDLLALINDILDLSKIEAGKMEMRPQQFRLSQLVDDLERTFQPVAEQKGLSFRTFLLPGCPETVDTDLQRLEQVLKNIISNAMKFTDHGEVTVSISRAEAGMISFAVTDTGIGIADGQQQAIFEAFRQADGTTNRKYGGTGLGLSISRELTRRLGGEITLTSQLGQGSTFTVTVPETYSFVPESSLHFRTRPDIVANPLLITHRSTMTSSDQTAVIAQRSAGLGRIEDDRAKLTGDRRVILVVEDDEAFARILYDLAHELDFQCLIATNAEDGVAAVIQYLPSAVVLDVGLPDHSGLSVLDRLKHDSRTRHIPVHVVSAGDFAQTALALGAVGYMPKPVKREQLVHALQNLESRLAQRLRSVLVVEDDPVQLDSLRRLLGSHDVETVGAQTAAECLACLKETTFDCMVLDLSLPDATGFSLLKTLSEEDTYAFPPVIVYTGRDLSAEEEQQLRRYSKSIIIKGAKSPERLLDEVTLFLHQVVSELPLEQQRMLEKARSRDSAIEGRRILIVEDDVRNIFALTSILEPRGAVLKIARNGREALETLKVAANDPAQMIDLVLMDVMMPEMDGITATMEIRKNSEWKKLPIIVLTAKAMTDDQERCLAAGANDYMAKPLDVEKLLSLVRVWMPR